MVWSCAQSAAESRGAAVLSPGLGMAFAAAGAAAAVGGSGAAATPVPAAAASRERRRRPGGRECRCCWRRADCLDLVAPCLRLLDGGGAQFDRLLVGHRERDGLSLDGHRGQPATAFSGTERCRP